MPRLLNTITRMSRLSPELAMRVKKREKRLFRNTLIKDGEVAYGYDKHGQCYLIDEEDTKFVAQYKWYRDKKGYLVTDNFLIEDEPICVEDLIMNFSEDCAACFTED